MIALKDRLFSDLQDPMAYLTHRGFSDNPFHCATVRAYKDFAFFKDHNGEESCCVTGPCRVLSSSIHQHDTAEYNQITVELDPDWIEALTPALEQACRRVFATPEALAQSKSQSADAFWETCKMPFVNNTITVKEAAFTRRGHKKQFMNIFNQDGKEAPLQIYTGGTVRLSLGFYMYESVFNERVYRGFRPKIVHGIRVLQTGGPPPVLKDPWSWHDVTFPTLAMAMHSSFQVRMPPMTVLSRNRDQLVLAIDDKPHFKGALQALYRLANVQWPDSFVVQYLARKTIVPGALAIVYAKPVRSSSSEIEWVVQKIHCHRAAAVSTTEASLVPVTASGTVPGTSKKSEKKSEKRVETGKRGETVQKVAPFPEARVGALVRKKRPSDTLDKSVVFQTKKQCR